MVTTARFGGVPMIVRISVRVLAHEGDRPSRDKAPTALGRISSGQELKWWNSHRTCRRCLCLNQIENPALDVGQALHGNWWRPNHFLSRHMTFITSRSSSKTEPVRLCRRKAVECQRTALTATNPNVRLRYFQLARLWREMAEEAARRTNGSSPSKGQGVVIFPKQFQKSPVNS